MRHPLGHSAIRILALAATLTLAGLPARAQRVEAFTPQHGAEHRLPGDGEARRFLQLAWTGVGGGLVRRSHVLTDPFHAEGYELIWQPRDVARDSEGPLSGRGVLTWIAPDALDAPRPEIVAQYRGDFAAGAMAGRGTFVTADGLRYEGDWRAGRMHGHGTLRLPGGTIYRGAFSQGAMEGVGTRFDPSGAVHDGQFRAGRPDGPGTARPARGMPYTGLWEAGEEVAGKRVPLTRAQAAIGDGVPGLLMRVALDDTPSFCCVTAEGALRYAAAPRPGGIDIFPDAPQLMDIWQGHANVVVPDPTGFNDGRWLSDSYTFANISDREMPAVTLALTLQNDTTRPVDVARAYIEVTESLPEPRPMLQATELTPLSLGSPSFSIENYGLAPAEDVTLSLRFSGPGGKEPTPPVEIAVGVVDGISQFSFAPALAGFGIGEADLPRIEGFCEFARTDDCLSELRASGLLGQLPRIVDMRPSPDVRHPGGVKYGLNFDGTLSFAWQDARGARQTDTVPFAGFVPLGALFSRGECEGGEFQDLSEDAPFDFRFDADGVYRIPLPISQTVPQGRIDGWRFALDADRTSRHRLRLVMDLADSRRIVSRELDMLFLRPRTFPTAIRPPQARC